jgi:hypothetical protein
LQLHLPFLFKSFVLSILSTVLYDLIDRQLKPPIKLLLLLLLRTAVAAAAAAATAHITRKHSSN